MNREIRAEQIIEAIKATDTGGLLTLVAKKAGVSYWTVWKYAQDFPTVKKALDERKEDRLDLAEAQLFTKIKNGNIAAIIFYLKTQGKERGYIERSEVTGAGGMPLMQVNVSSHEVKTDIENVVKRFSNN